VEKYQTSFFIVLTEKQIVLVVAVRTWKDSFLHPTWSGLIRHLRAQPAVAGQNAATNRRAPRMTAVGGGRGMGDIELEPGYSTKEVPGRCIKCLAEQESRNCLWELLGGEGRNKDLEQTYEAMIALLKSPELKKLRDESEKYLAEGKNVKIVMHLGDGEPKYEIKVD